MAIKLNSPRCIRDETTNMKPKRSRNKGKCCCNSEDSLLMFVCLFVFRKITQRKHGGGPGVETEAG